jgi:hypothetical protein
MLNQCHNIFVFISGRFTQLSRCPQSNKLPIISVVLLKPFRSSIIPFVSTMSRSELYTLTATEIADLVKRDEVTVEQYASSLLSRITERDGIVHA